MIFVLVHGAWGGGWGLTRLAGALRQSGDEVFTPTLTGLGEREHLATPDVGLSTHIQDVSAVLYYEDLRDVVLVGHSYGGAVVTGVADRHRERLRHLIYLDAFVLRDGESMADLLGPEMTGALRGLAAGSDGGWRFPSPFSGEQFGVSDPEERAWMEARLCLQPMKTLQERLALRRERLPFPVTYVTCTVRPMGLFENSAERAKAAGWELVEFAGTHAAPAVAPGECAQLLREIAQRASILEER